MKKFIKPLVLALPLMTLALGGSAFASSKKDSWQCINDQGKEVPNVKTKNGCTTPNKWMKTLDKTSSAKATTAAHKPN